MTPRAPLSPPGDIPELDGKVWLYTGAEGPPLARQQAAAQAYLSNRGLAEAGRAAHAEVEERLRRRIATLLGLGPESVALLSNASEAINLVVGSVPLVPGDNIVLNAMEYPSMVQPWLRWASRGVDVRVAPAIGGDVPASSITDLIDDRTKVVGVSHVSYLSGWRHDLTAITAAAEAVGALTLVDATQSLGVVRVPGNQVDVVISSSYKWLLGGHGLGILVWNTARRPLPEPSAVGWRSVGEIFTDDRLERYELHSTARRFEVGLPSYPSIYSLDASLAWLLQFPPEEVEEHVLALTGRLVDELSERGWELLTSTDDAHRAGNVSVRAQHGAELAGELAGRDVHCWGGDGRLRFSLHLFNGDRDVDRLLVALDSMRGPVPSDPRRRGGAGVS
ncbi:aminotransferase class V-fold PLP-dependent enzyme [Micromonospora echinofusca]|uniref:Aminotransferase class V-fold PLP-dependent enzyme n=1 Tax=Micromonospora echinofusca TaxID=47858 RepID=A0ABS3VKY7_MICEH|nr:aminotransferase class V-fold PLP-dependent enzyme [Micromonospora echinofusca]MBO4205195.1 aminotransferase class V-fold PLP-dependent enzyme [Micromonospora echinofusca]